MAAPEPRLPQSVAFLRERLEAPVEKLGRLFVVEDAWIAALRDAAERGRGPRQGIERRAAHPHITQSSC